MKPRKFIRAALYVSTAGLALCAPLGPFSLAQLNPSNAAILRLSHSSPFRNPDIIYLEADEVLDNRKAGIVTASGAVEARYQDRTLRADKVIYNITTGRVIATGNVVLVGGDGATQFADKIELTDKLASGSAKDFTARLNPVGTMGAAYAVRRSDEGIDLYNAYYTACKACKDAQGNNKAPSWRIKARRVNQDTKDKMIHYRDAVVEVKGVPVLYLPYLAHPDPSTERRSGLLMPFGGRSGGYGFFYEQPYYWALSESSEAVLTPRIMERVNPLIEASYAKKFHSGKLEIDGSFTYGEFFDNHGEGFSEADFFTNPDISYRGEKWRSHLFAHGHFDLTDTWNWGFGLQTATDDFYLGRYDIDEPSKDFGLYDGGFRRLTEQVYLTGQQEDFRYSVSAYGFQSHRSLLRRDKDNFNRIIAGTENDSRLPVVMPKIELDHYITEPLTGGRLHAFADTAYISRAFDGASTTLITDDYQRMSAGLDWSKSLILPGGIETKPFAMARHDSFAITPFNASGGQSESVDASRTIGHVGLDTRWTLIRPGERVDLTLEPRIQAVYAGGNDNANALLSTYREDSLGIDLDKGLLWSANKVTGFDLFQKGTRIDAGVSLAGTWGESRASAFIGQSYASGYDEIFAARSGLSGDSSDYIGEVEIDLNNRFIAGARMRYDDDTASLRRIDTNLRYLGERLNINARYYKINDPINPLTLISTLDAPPESLDGSISYKISENWSARYLGSRDIDAGLTRREELGFVFNDDCTRVEVFYEKKRNDIGLNGNSSGFGVRIALLTLGDFTDD